jgi:hypothetical protein
MQLSVNVIISRLLSNDSAISYQPLAVSKNTLERSQLTRSQASGLWLSSHASALSPQP